MRLALLACPAALLAAAPALAQSQPGVPVPGAAATAEVRVNQLLIYGDDPCPPGSNEEIIVCARLPEDDRFRIPSNLRENPNDPASQSWANRALELSYVGRNGIGSCSTAGPGGMVGCQQQIINQARAERSGDERIDWNRLIDEARQERLRRVGEAAAEEEEADRGPD